MNASKKVIEAELRKATAEQKLFESIRQHRRREERVPFKNANYNAADWDTVVSVNAEEESQMEFDRDSAPSKPETVVELGDSQPTQQDSTSASSPTDRQEKINKSVAFVANHLRGKPEWLQL